MTEMMTLITEDGSAPAYTGGLSDEALVHCSRPMLLVRAFDDICMKLQRSGRIGFSVPNKGVEATQVGAASALRSSDIFFPSYRDFGIALYHGVRPAAMMNNMFGNAGDSAKGRQMPVHFSFVDPIRYFSISSPIGTHLPQAVGAAYASSLRGEDDVTLVSFGDGGTSNGNARDRGRSGGSFSTSSVARRWNPSPTKAQLRCIERSQRAPSPIEAIRRHCGSSQVLAAHHEASSRGSFASTRRPRTSCTAAPSASTIGATIPSGARYAAATGGGREGTAAA